jgi:hypothetical protein
MSLQIQEVPFNLVNQVWPKVEGFIDAALQYSEGEYTVGDARVYVTNGAWTLVVAVDTDGAIHGAALVSYFNRPSNRVAFVTAIGGKLVSNRSTWAQFESIMRSNGATYLEGAARESIVRLWSRYGMQHKYHIVGKSL